MSEFANDFVTHLGVLSQRQPGAMAALRRSMGFAPGAYPPAYPHVERFVAAQHHAQHPQRLALYLVAGLYAMHPKQSPISVAGSLAQLVSKRGKDQGSSLEKRFIALLGADTEGLPHHLRQIVSLLSAGDIGLNYVALLNDLRFWLNPGLDPEKRDRIRQRWARDFYRALIPATEESSNVIQN